MLLHSNHHAALLGAITLVAGLSTSVATGAETKKAAVEEPVLKLVDVEASKSDAERQREGMVEVRISMPDGRVVIRYEQPRTQASRRSFPAMNTVSKRLADGSRISFVRHGVGGGSSSVARGSSSSASSSSSSGGGGSSSSFGSSGSSGASSSGSHSGGGSSGGGSTSSGASGSSGGGGSSLRAGGGHSGGGSSSVKASSSTDVRTPHVPRSVPTVGHATYTDFGAVGGQKVEFLDTGIYASIVGQTAYFTGVQLVQANQAFEVIAGTRLGEGSAIMQEGRLGRGDSNPLSSSNTASSSIRLDFESGTTVDLVMLSNPENPGDPNREQRTWTVRIR